MGLFPGSVDSPKRATTYGTLPDHGQQNVAIILHTTETLGMPSFRDGLTAPHYVYSPMTRVWTMFAEYEDGYVGTLVGHTRDGHGNCKAFQVEILGYSNEEYHPNVTEFTDENYEDLARFVKWARGRYKIEDDYDPTPAGGFKYGLEADTRMSVEEWEHFGGLACHGSVPGNKHWDTGKLDLARISILAGGDIPDPDPDPGDEYMRPTLRAGDGYLDGPRPEVRGAVVGVQQQLAYHDHADPETADKTACAADGAYGPGTTGSVTNFQAMKGLLIDGIVGDQTYIELDKPRS